ncbi:MAG: sugar-binding protein, partial [Bacteroidota bacterium]
DHYSIYFDMSNIKQNKDLLDDVAEPMDSVQFMLEKIWSVAGGLPLNLKINNDTLMPGVDFVEVVDSGTSYTLEIAVPFAAIGVTLTPDMVIGFDSKVGDNDGDGNLDGKLSLYQTADESWHNASYIGTAKLEADGSLSKVMTAPVIDGVADYTWYSAASYKLEVKNLATGIDNAADFSGTFKVMHDIDNIYVYLEVKDDTLVTTLNNSWERDHYSLYFDISNLKQNADLVDDLAEPMDSVQFMLEKIWSVAGGLPLNLKINNDTLMPGVDFVEIIDTGSMYRLEIAVPFSAIGVTLTEDMVIGFDAKIGDNDGDGNLDGKLSWHQSADESWHNGGYMGNLKLLPVFVDLGSTKAAPQQMAIDGVVEGNWNQAIAMPLLRENLVTGITNAADFSGTVKALWDADNVYILLQVKDDTLVTTLNNSWERDHYSVYFDISNLKQNADLVDDLAEPMDSVQFMLEKIWSVAGGLPLNLKINNDTLMPGVDFVEVIDSGTSYLLELAVPFSSIGVNLTAGKVIGFDAKIGDNDGDGNLDGKLSWNQIADESWHNASFIGTVTLMGNGTFMGTPITPPEDVTFNVDMTGMISNGIFDPAVDHVDLAGSMNNWGDPVKNATDADADGIYTIVVAAQEVDAVLEFKFRVNGQWDGTEEFPGGGPNRTYTVIEGDNVVDVVYNDGDYTPWVGIEMNEVFSLYVYPNPATDMVNIRSSAEIHAVTITNLVGQSVLNIPVNSFNSEIGIGSLEAGMYVISVQFDSKEVYNRVLIKK